MDFLEKPFRPAELVTCIETSFQLDLVNRKAERATELVRKKFESLTLREREVANFIVAHPSSTSSKEIGRQLNISPRTVDHHRAQILQKMSVGSVAELIDLVGSGVQLQRALQVSTKS